MTLKDEVFKYLQNSKDKRIVKKSVINKTPFLQSIVNRVYEQTSFLDENTGLKERVYCIINDITTKPICLNPNCNNQPPYRDFHNGFNKTCSPACRYKTLKSPMKGKKFSKESREKLSESCKGKIPWNKGKLWDESVKQKMRDNHPNYSGKNHPKYGMKLSQETINKIQQSRQKTISQKDKDFFRHISIKGNETKKKNGTFCTSSIEIELYKFLQQYFPSIKGQYQSDLYPFACDYYIPEYDLYIELQGSWTHGGKAFNKKQDSEKLSEWIKKSEKSEYYKNAIYTWTDLDIRKREIAKDNNLNFLEVFDYSDFENILVQIDRVMNGLTVKYSKKEQNRELEIIENSYGNYNAFQSHNKVVLSYQNHFYEKENELWKDPFIRRKTIENRIKYLNKKESELTNNELLRGFKISGIHYGYSHFSPLWIKAFIDEFNIQSIYDPCGGWGHRLLGAWDIDYIYNDINYNTYNGVKSIWDNFSNNHSLKVFYNEDAAKLTLNHSYDAVFTCPPYHNLENYGVEIISLYDRWLNEWWYKVVQNSIYNCNKYFAFISSKKIKEDLIKICLQCGLTIIKDIKVGTNSYSHFQTNPSEEHLIVFSI